MFFFKYNKYKYLVTNNKLKYQFCSYYKKKNLSYLKFTVIETLYKSFIIISFE